MDHSLVITLPYSLAVLCDNSLVNDQVLSSWSLSDRQLMVMALLHIVYSQREESHDITVISRLDRRESLITFTAVLALILK